MKMKILKKQLNLDVDVTSDPSACLLNSEEYFEDLYDELQDGGSYLIWDKVNKKWVRTGKALVLGSRKKQHATDKDKETTALFYQTYGNRWNDIAFKVSITLDDSNMDEAARFMVFNSRITAHLEAKNTKWGKPNKDDNIHEVDMRKRHLLCYLLEKVDDLLADRSIAFQASESIGFEGPLWNILPTNVNKRLYKLYDL